MFYGIGEPNLCKCTSSARRREDIQMSGVIFLKDFREKGKSMTILMIG